jgi:hypothetical protein
MGMGVVLWSAAAKRSGAAALVAGSELPARFAPASLRRVRRHPSDDGERTPKVPAAQLSWTESGQVQPVTGVCAFGKAKSGLPPGTGHLAPSLPHAFPASQIQDDLHAFRSVAHVGREDVYGQGNLFRG